MPFGLDLKSLIVGILLAYFVIPMLTGMLGGLGRPTRGSQAAA